MNHSSAVFALWMVTMTALTGSTALGQSAPRGGTSAASLAHDDPAADPAAVVVAGNARFTVLTPRLIRLEWAPNAAFEDRASLLVLNRKLSVPAFTTKRDGGTLEIKTDVLMLRYKEGGPFTAANLRIDLPAHKAWRPGMPDTGNLLGTWRTLDGVSGATQLETGLLSRTGWTLLDDSSRVLLAPIAADEKTPAFGWSVWPKPRDKDGATDWYFFQYGTDYVQGLQDFTAIAGRIPLPPRFVFGAWWSRYWAYTDAELRQLVGEFREHDVPLDVLVIDMDWHLPGWTGYTWNPEYFPDPKGFLDWTQSQGLMVPLNLHPADGVGKQEAAFPEFCKAMGLDPEKTERIPFNCTDRRYVDAYFRLLHRPLEKQGVDFWWTDWQQGDETDITGLDPLWWLNYLHWNDWLRDPGPKFERPLIFSRWGGLGNHRYQIGFSGDTFCNWPSLAFQPYFTATAGNVGYAYWSHDIGGHQPGKVDPELYGRWIQWGALSPILRTHTTKNPAAERRIWAFDDETFRVTREAWLLRYALIPYIYTAARECYDTALPLCRPLYYQWPSLAETYKRPGEYMFGDDLLAAPVVEPASTETHATAATVWLPPGTWCNWFTGRVYSGPGEVRLLVPRDEIPLFARAGAIIPLAPPMKYSREKPVDPLILDVFPGDRGRALVYEDDGLTQGYTRGAYAQTPVEMQRADGGVSVVIGPVSGAYDGMPAQRAYEVRIRNASPPRAVTLDGEALAPAATADGPGWRYDVATMSLIIRTPAHGPQDAVRIDAAGAADEAFGKLAGDGLRQLRNVLEALLARAGDGAPAAAHDALATIDGAIAAGAGAAERLAALRGASVRIARDLSDAALPTALKTEFITRLLGVFPRLDLRATDDPLALDATFEAAFDPILHDGSPTQHDLSFDPPDNWQHGAVERSTGRDIAGHEFVRLATRLRQASALQTAVLNARIDLTGGDGAFSLPVRKTLLPSVNAWWILGPVAVQDVPKLDEMLPRKPRLDDVFRIPGLEGDVGWAPYTRHVAPGDDLSSEFFVNFGRVFGTRYDHAAAYVLVFLKAPRAMPARLAIGSDDGFTAWLNSEKIHSIDVGRAYTSREDRVPVTFKAGDNVLLLRIDQRGGDWGFSVHVETPDGDVLPEVEARLEP